MSKLFLYLIYSQFVKLFLNLQIAGQACSSIKVIVEIIAALRLHNVKNLFPWERINGS